MEKLSEKASENDADIFFENADESPSFLEDSSGKHELLSAFKHNFLIPKPNPTEPLENWYEFKANDGVSQMISRKFAEKQQEKSRIELENKKKVKKLLKNPIEYINFIKVFLLCSLANIVAISKVFFGDILQALVLSKFSNEEITILEKIAISYKSGAIPMDFMIKDLFKVFSRRFVYKKGNESYLWRNIAFTDNYTHEQIIWIFIALCQYLKIPVRFLSIIDLRTFNLERKYRFFNKNIDKNVKKNQKKRKINEGNRAISLKKKKTEGNLIDKCIRSLIFDKKTDFHGITEENPEEKLNENEKNTMNFPDLDDFLQDFEYKRPVKSSSQKLPENLLKNLPKNLSNSSDLLNISSFNFSPTPKKPEENGVITKGISEEINDIYDDSDYKYWLEIYDFELNRFIVINPIIGEIYKETNPEYVQLKTQGIPALFIISSFKITDQSYRNPSYLYKKHGIFLTDSTIKYCEKWTKTLILRRQLSLKWWWEQLETLLDPCRFLMISEPFYSIFNNERLLYEKILIEDIPLNYNEFRNSPYYLLPSHLKKYQGLKPWAFPIEMTFKDEPVYRRSDAVDLHTKSKWKTKGKKVKTGELGLKKVLALFNDGEQMVDLYGEWQTEELKNTINEDGSLPRNEYGNYELFEGVGEVPKGTKIIDLPYIAKLCKKYEIQCVEIVVGKGFFNDLFSRNFSCYFKGFEKKNGRSHPVKQGVLILEHEKERVLQLYEDFAKELLEKEKEKEDKKLIGIWRKLLKSLLIKRYIQQNYENM